MLKKFEAQQYVAQAEEGMEMIQVAFSIAIAVMLGVIVVSFVNNVVVPGMEQVTAGAKTMFDTILTDNSLGDNYAPSYDLNGAGNAADQG